MSMNRIDYSKREALDTKLRQVKLGQISKVELIKLIRDILGTNLDVAFVMAHSITLAYEQGQADATNFIATGE